MLYVGIVLGLYLILGVVLTRWLTVRAPGMRIRFNDLVMGALSMPVIIATALICVAASKLWVRLLLLLDYEPEERPDSAKANNGTPPQ
jgi:hypothetical protein